MSDSEQKPAARPRFRRGPQALALDAVGLLRHHLASRGFARVELVTRWTEIAGTQLAQHCYPYRLSAGATLTLMADDRAALELQHQAPKLIDKINAYFGSTVVSKIKVLAGDIPRPTPLRTTNRPLNAEEEAKLESDTRPIADPDLRAALTRLGRHALAESRKAAIYKR